MMKRLNPLNSALYQCFSGVSRAALIVCALTAAAPLNLLAGKPAPPPSYAYTIRQLNPPSGASSASANSMNNQGRIVGSADFPNYEWAGCIWEPNGQTVILPLLPTAQVRRGRPSSISDTGLISGSSVTYTGNGGVFGENIRATFWESVSGGYQARDWNDLMPETGVHLNRSTISSDGQYIVFAAANRLTGAPATVIAQVQTNLDGSVTGLNLLDVLPATAPHDINHDGLGVVRVLGATVGSGSSSYFLWKSDGSGVHLTVAPYTENPGPLDGSLNKFGQVANSRRLSLSNTSALLWNESDLWNLTAARNLGTFGGATSRSGGINDLGQVVGVATTAGKQQQERAFLFQNNTLYDLNLLAPVGKLVLSFAHHINNAGQILAGALVNGSSTVDVLLTPVP